MPTTSLGSSCARSVPASTKSSGSQQKTWMHATTSYLTRSASTPASSATPTLARSPYQPCSGARHRQSSFNSFTPFASPAEWISPASWQRTVGSLSQTTCSGVGSVLLLPACPPAWLQRFSTTSDAFGSRAERAGPTILPSDQKALAVGGARPATPLPGVRCQHRAAAKPRPRMWSRLARHRGMREGARARLSAARNASSTAAACTAAACAAVQAAPRAGHGVQRSSTSSSPWSSSTIS